MDQVIKFTWALQKIQSTRKQATQDEDPEKIPGGEQDQP